jgi:hypothetical protein
MENEQAADAILSVLQQLLEAAGPEWTLEALTALMQEVGGGAEQMPPEAMGQPAPQAMPPAAPGRGMMGRKIN